MAAVAAHDAHRPRACCASRCVYCTGSTRSWCVYTGAMCSCLNLTDLMYETSIYVAPAPRRIQEPRGTQPAARIAFKPSKSSIERVAMKSSKTTLSLTLFPWLTLADHSPNSVTPPEWASSHLVLVLGKFADAGATVHSSRAHLQHCRQYLQTWTVNEGSRHAERQQRGKILLTRTQLRRTHRQTFGSLKENLFMKVH